MIQNAKGIAIFTTMRTGLWISGAGGSGVLLARLPDGTWSPPSGLMLHTAGVGFLVGVDIYDCVMVINTEEALAAFQKVRCTIGGEISAVAGPVGIGGVLDSEVHKRRAPIFTYLKSRGFYAGVQIDGTILIERSDENERFYGYRMPVQEILSGKVRHPPREIQTLMQTIKAAQGDHDVDESLLPTEAPPSDFEIFAEPKIFGVPDKDDPDPYGVLALEKEGFSIREAGSLQRPTWEHFAFNPSPSSPIFSAFARNSIDGKSLSRRSSWRTSTMSTATNATANTHTGRTRPTSTMSDTATQTDFEPPTSPTSPNSRRMAEITEETQRAQSNSPVEPAKTVSSSIPAAADPPRTPTSPQGKDSPYVAGNERHNDMDADADADDDLDGDLDAVIEEPIVVHEVHHATSPQVLTRARVVQVAKKPQPPALPPRNPVRQRKASLTEPNAEDAGTMTSPSAPPFPQHSRDSSASTYREQEQERSSGGRRSGSDDLSSVSSVEMLERKLQAAGVEGGEEDKSADAANADAAHADAEVFHSIPTTPARESVDGPMLQAS